MKSIQECYFLYVDKKEAIRYGEILSTPQESTRKIASSLGRVIRRQREALGLSQERFAELSQHHRTYIGFLERGERSPNVETLNRVAGALGVKASDLLREAGY